MWIYFLFAIREREYADSTGHGVEQKKDREPTQSLGSQIYQSKGILQWSQKKKKIFHFFKIFIFLCLFLFLSFPC